MTLAVVVAVAGWAVVAVAVVNLVSQWCGWNRPVPVMMVQSLSRPLLLAVVATAVAAVPIGRWELAAAAALASVATGWFLFAITRPTAAQAGLPDPATDGRPTLTISHGNVWFANTVTPTDPQRVVDALRRADPDVIAISEYSHDIAAAFAGTTLPHDYPHHVVDPDTRGLGSAIFSRRPLTPLTPPRTSPRTTAALIDGITVFAVHTPSPLENLPEWNEALAEWSALVPRDGQPTVAIGDFNADLIHPALRVTLAAGWRDAHRELGATASTSWPTHLRAVPPFVRLDRVLVSDGVELRAVSGTALPGSDHRIVTVTVALPDTSITAAADADERAAGAQ